jgi:WhiB family redox-sensing transcriptional regulator
MESKLTRCRPCGSLLPAASSVCHTCRALIAKDLGSEWTHQAVCAQIDPELWFPENGQNVSPTVDATCASCPVRRECLRVGLHEPHGIWAGFRPDDRERLRARLWNATPEARNTVTDSAAILGRASIRNTPKENK